MSTTTETVKCKCACAKDKAAEKINEIKDNLSKKGFNKEIFKEEKEKVADKLKDITEQGLEYSAKAADFISSKAHAASENLKK